MKITILDDTFDTVRTTPWPIGFGIRRRWC
jgi:hypothetical protein